MKLNALPKQYVNALGAGCAALLDAVSVAGDDPAAVIEVERRRPTAVRRSGRYGLLPAGLSGTSRSTAPT